MLDMPCLTPLGTLKWPLPLEAPGYTVPKALLRLKGSPIANRTAALASARSGATISSTAPPAASFLPPVLDTDCAPRSALPHTAEAAKSYCEHPSESGLMTLLNMPDFLPRTVEGTV